MVQAIDVTQREAFPEPLGLRSRGTPLPLQGQGYGSANYIESLERVGEERFREVRVELALRFGGT